MQIFKTVLYRYQIYKSLFRHNERLRCKVHVQEYICIATLQTPQLYTEACSIKISTEIGAVYTLACKQAVLTTDSMQQNIVHFQIQAPSLKCTGYQANTPMQTHSSQTFGCRQTQCKQSRNCTGMFQVYGYAATS